MSGLITASVVGAVGIGAGLYESSQQQGIENQALGIASSQNSRQAYSFQQLQSLISNPGSFFSSPVYQAAFGQGTQAVTRQEASGGFLNSGNEATALQAYGQSFGASQLLSQEQLLASMSGTSANPASALGTASGAGATSFNQLGTLLAALGQSGSMFNGGYSGVAGMDTGSYDASLSSMGTSLSNSVPLVTPTGPW
jgi:hypothetical protein